MHWVSSAVLSHMWVYSDKRCQIIGTSGNREMEGGRERRVRRTTWNFVVIGRAALVWRSLESHGLEYFIRYRERERERGENSKGTFTRGYHGILTTSVYGEGGEGVSSDGGA